MSRKPRASIVFLGALLLMIGARADSSYVRAQDRWDWPERARNLKVLPPDAPPSQLRAVMTGFTRALGVRCSHCHVGEEGKPLGTYDFASDADPEKDTARAMLKMLGKINEELKSITPTGPAPVNMWCHTCHQGRPRPQTLEEALTETLEAEGIDAAVARYRALRERHYGRGGYDFGEAGLNNLGYSLLGRGRTDEAIGILRLNAEFFPASANVHDSLAEAYLRSGARELAAIYYGKSLELDPGNENALEKLRELRREP